jgi:predicted PurR-regulated permease PerM
MNIRDIKFIKIDKKQIIESIILYTTTLVVTVGLIYLLFPSLTDGLSEVKKVNGNVVVINEKLDSIKSGQDYVTEQANGILETNFYLNDRVVDSIVLLNKKLDLIQKSINQNNRIINQNIREIQSLKNLYYQKIYNTQSSDGTKVNSLNNLFRKE